MNKNVKKILPWALGGVACAAVVVGLFNGLLKNVTERTLPWWVYIADALIVALLGYIGYLVGKMQLQRFERMLAKESFCVDKRYDAQDQTLCIDFRHKRIANTYLSTKPFIDFADVVGCRVESFCKGSRGELPEDRRYLGIVVTVRRDDPTPDHPYLYIALFEEELSASDVPDPPDVTEEMVAAHPELQPLFDLKRDVETIVSGAAEVQ